MFISPPAPDFDWCPEDQTRLTEAVAQTRQTVKGLNSDELITVSGGVALFGIKKPTVHQGYPARTGQQRGRSPHRRRQSANCIAQVGTCLLGPGRRLRL